MYQYKIGLDLITGCSASIQQNNYPCTEAYDGITDQTSNGWAYHGQLPAWVIFELASKVTISSLELISGQTRNHHRLIKFKVTFIRDSDDVILKELKEFPDASIGMLKYRFKVLLLDGTCPGEFFFPYAPKARKVKPKFVHPTFEPLVWKRKILCTQF